MTTYTKLQAAAAQLDKAISLFLSDEHLCATTLGGAAEEILGTLSKKAGNVTAVDYIAEFHAPTFAAAGEPMTRTEIVTALNRARNGAKHADAGGDELSVDWADSMSMLMRAIPMARELGVHSDEHEKFRNWLQENNTKIDEYMNRAEPQG